MAETITLTTPVVRPSTTKYDPVSLMITIYPSAVLRVVLISDIGVLEVFDYPAASTNYDTPAKVLVLINTLNTVNLATRSLWKRIMDRLLIDFPTRFNTGGVVS